MNLLGAQSSGKWTEKPLPFEGKFVIPTIIAFFPKAIIVFTLRFVIIVFTLRFRDS